jgi:CRISPR-associated protein Cas2
MLILVSYDIPDDRRRTKLAHGLKDFGVRVQYSVFECNLETDELAKLEARVKHQIDPEEDSVRIYRLCAGCREKVAIHGVGNVTEDPNIYVL